MDGLASAIGGGNVPQGADDDGQSSTPFAPRKRREEPKGLFDLPDDPLKEGEATAQAVAENIAWLRREGFDARCDAHVLGTVPEVFAGFGAVLDERSLEVGRWLVAFPLNLKPQSTKSVEPRAIEGATAIAMEVATAMAALASPGVC